MSLQYRNNPHWKAALELGPALARLADELPAAESNGLSQTLRALMVELPAAIAADLLSDTHDRRLAVLKLVAAIELIDHVYPALDTAATRGAVERLANQLLADNFSETDSKSDAAPEAASAEPAESAPPAPPSSVPVLEAAPAPVPAPPPAAPDVAASEAPATPQPTVTIQPTAVPVASQENHVQPDSGQ
jgi:hypothetical protein